MKLDFVSWNVEYLSGSGFNAAQHFHTGVIVTFNYDHNSMSEV